ncbi:hypothetical protein DdX_17361 [Ditylenchus destructor]|uniref:Uncharacterized protein n=1 Tax=Ditylenchus destructor TaxID=166010 RepID=A0AAD4QVV7_9BILA|nr:hypothetical protein DdX_17361 [Ditylenchus destructor]
MNTAVLLLLLFTVCLAEEVRIDAMNSTENHLNESKYAIGGCIGDDCERGKFDPTACSQIDCSMVKCCEGYVG